MTQFLANAEATTTFLITMLVQSTLILAVGLVAARVLRRQGAAVQSTVLRVTLVAVLACPLASWLLVSAGVEGFGITVPGNTGVDSIAVNQPSENRPVVDERDDAVSLNEPSQPVTPPTTENRPPATYETPAEQPMSAAGLAQPPLQAQKQPKSETVESTTLLANHSDSSGQSVAEANEQESSLSAHAIVLVAWGLISALLLMRTVVAYLLVNRRRAECVAADPSIQQQCQSLAKWLGVAQPHVLVSADIQSPCLVGVWRPTILLPADLQVVGRDVLVHELAHLRRRDCAWQLTTHITTALCWWQPLMWRLARRMEQTADDVADDTVVQFGVDRVEYARQLVDIAERYQSDWSAQCAGAGIVSLRSSLAKRVVRILDTSRSLSTRTSLLTMLVISLLGAAGTLAAGLLGTGETSKVVEPNKNSVQVSRDAQDIPATVAQDEPVAEPAAESQEPPRLTEQERAKRYARHLLRLKRRTAGFVLDPQGNPVEGAKVYLGLGVWGGDNQGFTPTDPIQVTTDADGQFVLDYRQWDLFDNPEAVPDLMWPHVLSSMTLVADADGFGPAWVTGAKEVRPSLIRLQLVPERVLEGRLLTLEGTPAANTRVRLSRIRSATPGSLKFWLDALKSGEGRANDNTHFKQIVSNLFALPSTYQTDAQGRFKISGLGQDRVADLIVDGANVAQARLIVVNRKMESLPTNLPIGLRLSQHVYGSGFERIVAPSQPIVGIVRDAKTGAPMPHVRIESYRFADSRAMGNRSNLLTAETNAAGEFRLEGMPKGKGNRLLAVPNDDQPYFMREIPIPESTGLTPVRVEVKLHRGIWITGKVVDQSNGEPVMSTLHYLPYLSNSYASALPVFRNGAVDGGIGYQHRYVTKADGTFRVVGLPGRAIIGAETMSTHRRGAGARQIDGDADENGRFPTYDNPLQASLNWPNVMAEVNPDAEAESISVTLEAEQGSSVQLSVVDNQRKPASDFVVSGAISSSMWGEKVRRGRVTISGLVPGESRCVIVLQAARKLGRTMRIDDRRPIAVAELLPTARVRGRLVDKDGDGMPQATLTAYTLPEEDFNPSLPPITADANGEFEFATVPTGAAFRVNVRFKGKTRSRAFEVNPRPGETLELGDVVIPPRNALTATEDVDDENKTANNNIGDHNTAKKQGRSQATAQDAAQPNKQDDARRHIRGVVLDPDGKPAAGVTVRVPVITKKPILTPRDIALKPEATTDEEGRFEIHTSFVGFPNGSRDIPVVAHAKGYGVAWETLSPGKEQLTLKLAKDQPVRGKVVDTEGRPVANVEVEITGLIKEPTGSLDRFLSAWQKDWNVASMRSDRMFTPLGSVMGAETNDQGEFEIHGIGVERVAFLEFRHPQMAGATAWVVNRPGFVAKPYNDQAQKRIPAEFRRPGMVPRLVAPQFSQVLEPGRTIEGIVYTGKDRKPVARASVRAGVGYNMGVMAMTNEKGEYKLAGLAKQDEYLVMVAPAADDSNLLQRTLAMSIPAGKRSLKKDVELAPGVVVTGRIVDPKTKQGVRAGVRLVPLPGNEYFDKPMYDVHRRNRIMQTTQADGTFRIVTIPGPSMLVAQVHHRDKMGTHDVGPFCQATLTEEDAKRVTVTERGSNRFITSADGTIETLGLQNAAKYVDLPLDGEPTEVELVLDRGKTVDVQVLDEQGRPLDGVFAAGVTEHWPITFRLEDSHFTALALHPERPRKILFLDPKRKLAGSVTLTGEETAPVKVKLQPTASVSGRVSDEGAPLENAQVVVNFIDRTASELYRFSDLPVLTTDAQGAFRVDNLVPGERFVLDFREGESYYRVDVRPDQLQTEPGKLLEGGDMKLRKLR